MYPFEPVIDPAIPFVDGLQGGLQLGSMICINGHVPGSSNGFAVNLACGGVLEGSNRSPIAFHFNPRFADNYVARNCYKESWGTEENGGGNPMTKGGPFEIMILVEPNEYKVAVNGQHFATFNHRISFDKVNTLQITGDVAITKILFSGGQQPGPQPVYSPAIPFEHPIPGWLGPGRVINIEGVPRSFPDRFQVDLFNSEGGDVLLHFNPRYNPSRYVVRNSCIQGMWGEEQCDTPFFNFMPDARFNLKIAVDHDQFTVFVNDLHFCFYKHRMPFNLINHIRIDGDIDIDSVTFS